MDAFWSELQTHGTEVEERKLPEDEFEHLFGGELGPGPVDERRCVRRRQVSCRPQALFLMQ